MLTPSHETAADVVRLARVDRGRIRVVPLAAPVPVAPAGAPPLGPVRPLHRRDRAPQERRAGRWRRSRAPSSGVRLLMAGPWSARRAQRLRDHAARAGAEGRVAWLGLVDAGRLAAAARRRDGGARAVAQGGLRPAGAGGDAARRAGARVGHPGAARGGRRRGALPARRTTRPAWARRHRRAGGRSGAAARRAGGAGARPGRRSSRGGPPPRRVVAAYREVAA